MGAAMVRNLVAAGHQVTAYNRTRAKAEGLGAAVADSPAEASRGCDVVMSMLPDDRAVEEAVFGKDGIGDVPHIGCSTISTALARRLAAESRAEYVSACVFGRPDAAEAKKLIVVAARARGADRSAFSRYSMRLGGGHSWRAASRGRPTRPRCAGIS